MKIAKEKVLLIFFILLTIILCFTVPFTVIEYQKIHAEMEIKIQDNKIVPTEPPEELKGENNRITEEKNSTKYVLQEEKEKPESQNYRTKQVSDTQLMNDLENKLNLVAKLLEQVQ